MARRIEMVRVLALVTSLVLAGPMAAFAQAADPAAAAAEGQVYARDGFYVGASIAGVGHQGVSGAVERFVSDATQTVRANSETAVGVNLRVGYRMHPRVAGEIHWEWLTPAEIDLSGDLDYSDAFEVQFQVVSVNLKGYVLTAGNIQPFLLVGGGIMKGEVDGKNDFSASSVDGLSFVGRMGGGVEYYFTPHLVGAVDVTYVLPVGHLSEFPYISGGLGLQYRF
jgi:opacity protein-like surface antigen